MSLGTFLTGVIIISICAFPFILIGLNSSKNKKMILNELKLTAKENGCNIKQYDIWKKTGIALCENGNTLVFYRKTNDNIEYRNAVLLNEFSQCKPQKVMHTEDAYTEIESLALELSSNQLKKSTLLEFFNTNKDTSTLGNEVLILHKWESLVTERLAKK